MSDMEEKLTVHYLRTDLYTSINPDCPVNVDLYPVDDVVVIALGEHRFGDDTLQLVIAHPDTFRKLTEALHHARDQLVAHLRAKASHHPVTSQPDSTFPE